jgi:insertion element IS1 protein InsB
LRPVVSNARTVGASAAIQPPISHSLRQTCFSSFCHPRKKGPELQPVNHAVLAALSPEQVEVELGRADELEVRRGLSSELDEMWSYVARKSNPRWLWHAIDHHTGKVLAYVFGRRKDDVFLKLQKLLEPIGITRFYTDGWGAYERYIDAEKHQVGKENTQKIESKHINLRTRIKRLMRRTICFSKTEQMHDLVIGLFINRYEFGQAL